MDDPMVREELLARLRDGVVSFDADQVQAAARQALAEGLDALDAVLHGLVPGLALVAELYDDREYFLPELLMSADAAAVGAELLVPHLLPGALPPIKGVLLARPAEEKIEQLACRMMGDAFRSAGLEVLVAPGPLDEAFVRQALPPDTELVGLSVLMNLEISNLVRIVGAAREVAPQTRFILGQSPVTDDPLGWLDADGSVTVQSNPVREAIGLAVTLGDWLRGKMGEAETK